MNIISVYRKLAFITSSRLTSRRSELNTHTQRGTPPHISILFTWTGLRGLACVFVTLFPKLFYFAALSIAIYLSLDALHFRAVVHDFLQ